MATNATSVRASGPGSVSTPAAPGAANTRTFLTHCFGRAVRSRDVTIDGRGCEAAARSDATDTQPGYRRPLSPNGRVGEVRPYTRVVTRKVYTRTGDDGTTALLFGGRVKKDAPGPTAYGAVDEAVAALGLARAECDPGSELGDLLVRLQRELFVAGAELATAPENRDRLVDGTTRVTEEMVGALEPVIDDVTTRFDPPQEFVLPGENRVAAALDVAR